MEFKNLKPVEVEVYAVKIRKDGTREDLGMIAYEGSWWKKIIFKLKRRWRKFSSWLKRGGQNA